MKLLHLFFHKVYFKFPKIFKSYFYYYNYFFSTYFSMLNFSTTLEEFNPIYKAGELTPTMFEDFLPENPFLFHT